MKYIVETWLTEEVIQVFYSEKEREEWMKDNCEWFSDGCFLKDTETRISCYETR